MMPFGSHVVEDGLLITAQNPKSTKNLSQAVVRKLKELKETDSLSKEIFL
jgi:putative intracellular protease/amidase